MTALLKRAFVSEKEYLEAETAAAVRHEYLAGEVHAMAGATAGHNKLALNLAASLHQHLRGGKCIPYMSDLRVRIADGADATYYYPDVLVDCSGLAPGALFTETPNVVVEVLSGSSERIDRNEKFWLYRRLASLQDYVVIDPRVPRVIIHRRANAWTPFELTAFEEILELPSLSFRLPLSEIYAGVLGASGQ